MAISDAGIIHSLLNFFLNTNSNTYSDEQARKAIFKATQPQVKQYKKGRENINSHFDKEKPWESVVAFRKLMTISLITTYNKISKCCSMTLIPISALWHLDLL